MTNTVKLVQPPTDEEGFASTFLQSQQEGYYYAKIIGQSNLKLPYWNKFVRQTHTSFKELSDRLASLIEKPKITQILGVPRDNLTDPKVRRILKNFSFAPPTAESDEPITTKTQYLILDIDRPPDPDTLDLTDDQKNKILHILNTFEEKYETFELEEKDVLSAARFLLSLAFRVSYKGEMFVRLSGSFGKPSTPFFRGHIYVPLTRPVGLDDIAAILYGIPFVDHTPYFNPTQPVFTSGPVILTPTSTGVEQGYGEDGSYIESPTPTPGRNPLSDHTLLERCYYDEGDGHALPSDVLQKLYIGEIKSRWQSRTDQSSQQSEGKVLPATELAGKKGAFNRVAVDLKSPYNANNWLLKNGYTPSLTTENSVRYISPQSTSGRAGTILFTDGYIYEFHEQSPLQSLARKHSPDRSVFTAYDLWYLDAKEMGNLPRFKHYVDKLVERDPNYQNVWTTVIQNGCSFLSPDITQRESNDIIKGMLEEVFHMGIRPDNRRQIYDVICSKVREMNIKDYKFTHSKLDKLYKEVTQDFAEESNTLHPGNSDSQNAHGYLERSQMFHHPKGDLWITESSKGDMLIPMWSVRELRSHVENLIPKKSSAPFKWNDGKIQSSARAVIREFEVRKSSGNEPFVNAKETTFLFADTESRVGIDVTTRAVFYPMLSHFVLHKLPFSRAEYEIQKTYAFDDTNWGKFLNSSFYGEEDNIEHLRDFFTYLFMPDRPGQVMLALIGVPRSGKSTIKNIMSALVGRDYKLETSFKSLKDAFGLSSLSSLTRLFILNEFNISGGKEVKQEITDLLKSIAGADSVTCRRMYQGPTEVHPIALPVLLSNYIPNITDRAMWERIRLIEFKKSFMVESMERSFEFKQELEAELPFIFHWALSNPRYDGRTITWHRSDTMNKNKERAVIQASPYDHFISKYFEEGHPHDKIFRLEIRMMFEFFWNEMFGEDLDYDDLNIGRKLDIRAFRKIFPGAASAKKKISLRVRENKMNQHFPERDWCISGVRWRDYEGMIKEFSPFIDYVDNKEFKE